MNDLAREESSFLKEKHKISSQNFFLWPGHICERYIPQKMGKILNLAAAMTEAIIPAVYEVNNHQLNDNLVEQPTSFGAKRLVCPYT